MAAPWEGTQCSAFENGRRRIASGALHRVALEVKALLEAEPHARVLVFDDETGGLIDLDLRGSAADIRKRLGAAPAGPLASSAESDAAAGADGSATAARGRGRPKLGVVAREVTLLPRHWDWLNGQPGGASVALRKLVDQARRDHDGKDRVRLAREAAYRFLSAIAGDRAQFEEASRALFAGDAARFDALTARWPADVRTHAHTLGAGAFPASAADGGTEPGPPAG